MILHLSRHSPLPDARTSQVDGGISMPVNSPSVAVGAEWFSMIISYLKVKSLTLWFMANPDSCYDVFDEAWPLLLDEMMHRATGAAIEQLQTIVQISMN
jgi:hypothetical protein